MRCAPKRAPLRPPKREPHSALDPRWRIFGTIMRYKTLKKWAEIARRSPNRMKRRNRSTLSAPWLAVVLPAIGLTLPASAQVRTSSADTELLLNGGDQTVFTASKKTQKVSDVPAAVTI